MQERRSTRSSAILCHGRSWRCVLSCSSRWTQCCCRRRRRRHYSCSLESSTWSCAWWSSRLLSLEKEREGLPAFVTRESCTWRLCRSTGRWWGQQHHQSQQLKRKAFRSWAWLMLLPCNTRTMNQSKWCVSFPSGIKCKRRISTNTTYNKCWYITLLFVAILMMCVWSFLLHFPKLQPTLHFQLSFKPSCISWASTWPRVILFITEMQMATTLVLVLQDAQALDLIALGRISLSAPCLWQFLLQEEILKEFLFVCLFVSVWSVAVEASAFTAHGVECTTSGCLLAAPRREGTRQQYPRQYQNPFAPHLFTNISPTLYIFCLISFPFRGGTVLFFFWFQASWYPFCCISLSSKCNCCVPFLISSFFL